jgi:hypothetical protein
MPKGNDIPGVYRFPDPPPAEYVYQEYPRWITLRDNSKIVVNTPAEHAAHPDAHPPFVAEEPASPEPPAPAAPEAPNA